MKYFSLSLFIIVALSSHGQDKNLLQQKKYFDQELKKWANSFSKFNLSHFNVQDRLHFDNNYQQDFKELKKFLSIYKPIITFSKDSSKFIDIYSYQLGLEKKGNYFEANPDIDQAILLCDKKTKYWDRIYFGGMSRWIDEAIWTTATKFILVGISRSTDYKRTPLIILGDTEKQTLIEYLSINKSDFQNNKGYSSLKLKRLTIKGL